MSKELNELIVEQALDDKSNGVADADAFSKFVFAEIEKLEKLGKMSLIQLMRELDLVIEQYKGREE